MRDIDDIIRAVNEHPYIWPVFKHILIKRIEKEPTREEIEEAKEAIWGHQ